MKDIKLNKFDNYFNNFISMSKNNKELSALYLGMDKSIVFVETEDFD